MNFIKQIIFSGAQSKQLHVHFLSLAKADKLEEDKLFIKIIKHLFMLYLFHTF